MKLSSFALIQSATLGFLATANAQIFSNTSSVEPSSTPTSPVTGLDVADINILNGWTGSKDSYDRYAPFVFTIDIDAAETGSVWFAPPAEFGGFPESIEFDYGTITNDGNNFTVEFTSVPDSGAATIEFVGSLTADGIAGIPSPDVVTFTSDSSSGSFSDNINFQALPETASSNVGLIGGDLYYSINVPSAVFDGSLSVASSSEEGYSFDSSYSAVYFVSTDAFNNGTLTAADGVNESEESSVLVSFEGSIPDGHVAVRVVYKAIISGSAESYSNTADLSLPSLPGALSKRDTTITFTSTIYVTGPLAGTVESSSSSVSSDDTDSSSETSATETSGEPSATETSGEPSATETSGTESGSSAQTTSVATATVTDLSTTVITTCPTCTGSHKTTDVYVSTVTATVSGIVTEYTTYCPISTVSKVKSHEGTVETATVNIHEVTSGVYTVKTEYIPISKGKTVTDLSTTVVTVCPTCSEKTATGTTAPVAPGTTETGSSAAPGATETGATAAPGATETTTVEGETGATTVKSVTVVTGVTVTSATGATGATTAVGTTGTASAEGVTTAAGTETGKPSSSITTIRVSTQSGVSTYEGAAANVQAGLVTILMAVAAFVL
ncbi:hypothetical protein KDRO_A03710 [Kluyveromyces lactis]|nr:hypothetical protein KDRO_A03710 [Kluyveromyces lactis]